MVVARIIPIRLMIPNILAQCAGAAAAAYSAERLRGYPTGAIPIADGNEWTVFAVEGNDEFLCGRFLLTLHHDNPIKFQ